MQKRFELLVENHGLVKKFIRRVKGNESIRKGV